MQISKSKKLYIFWAKFVAITLIIILLSQVCRVVTDEVLDDGFLYSYEDKMKILKNTQGEKTVFIGGSSVLFGVSAERYEELSGKPAVNMGLNAGPYDFYLATVAPYIGEGDTVVLAFEHIAYTDKWYKFNSVAVDLTNVYDEYCKDIPLKHKPDYLFKQCIRYYEKMFSVINKKIASIIGQDTFYARNIVNDYGDVKIEMIEGSKNPSPQKKIDTKLNPDAMEQILRYVNMFEEKGATVYIAFPPCYIDRETVNVDEMGTEIEDYFGNRVIGNINDWLFETNEQFYDTMYHLNSEGVIKHTEYYYDLVHKN